METDCAKGKRKSGGARKREANQILLKKTGDLQKRKIDSFFKSQVCVPKQPTLESFEPVSSQHQSDSQLIR